MAEQLATLRDDKWTEGLRTFDGREQLLTWAFEYLQVQTDFHQISSSNWARISDLLKLVESCHSHGESVLLVQRELGRINGKKLGPTVKVLLEHRDGAPAIEGHIHVADGLSPPIGFSWMPSLVAHKGKAYKLTPTALHEPYIYRDVLATEVEVP